MNTHFKKSNPFIATHFGAGRILASCVMLLLIEDFFNSFNDFLG